MIILGMYRMESPDWQAQFIKWNINKKNTINITYDKSNIFKEY